jgi:hypothetical protein
LIHLDMCVCGHAVTWWINIINQISIYFLIKSISFVEIDDQKTATWNLVVCFYAKTIRMPKSTSKEETFKKDVVHNS